MTVRRDNGYRSPEYSTAETYRQNLNFIINGSSRIPIVFCIDVSRSMNTLMNPKEDFEFLNSNCSNIKDGESIIYGNLKRGVASKPRIGEVKKAIRRMLEEMKKDPEIASSASVCCITFSEYADCIQEFTDMSSCEDFSSKIKLGEDKTNYTSGIQKTFDRLRAFRTTNAMAGNDCYTPIFVFMTDGMPTDKNTALAVSDMSRSSHRGETTIMPVLIGNGNNEIRNMMSKMTKDGVVWNLKTTRDVRRLFDEISKKIKQKAGTFVADEIEKQSTRAKREKMMPVSMEFVPVSRDLEVAFTKIEQEAKSDDESFEKEFKKLNLTPQILAEFGDETRARILTGVYVISKFEGDNVLAQMKPIRDSMARVKALAFVTALEGALKQVVVPTLRSLPCAPNIQLDGTTLDQLSDEKVTCGKVAWLLERDSIVIELTRRSKQRGLKNGQDKKYWERFHDELSVLTMLRNDVCHAGKPFADSDMNMLMEKMFTKEAVFRNLLVFKLLK